MDERTIHSTRFFDVVDSQHIHCDELQFKYYCSKCDAFMGCYFCEFNEEEPHEECQSNSVELISTTMKGI